MPFGETGKGDLGNILGEMNVTMGNTEGSIVDEWGV